MKATRKIAFETIKGEALRCAIKAGMVGRSKDGKGYDIAPFLAFWELLEPRIVFELMTAKEEGKEAEQFRQQEARCPAYKSDDDIAPQA